MSRRKDRAAIAPHWLRPFSEALTRRFFRSPPPIPLLGLMPPVARQCSTFQGPFFRRGELAGPSFPPHSTPIFSLRASAALCREGQWFSRPRMGRFRVIFLRRIVPCLKLSNKLINAG